MSLLLPAVALAGWPADPVSWEVDQGTEVVFVEDHRVPLVEVRVWFPVGSWSPWFAENGGAEAFEIQLYDEDSALRQRADELAASFSFHVDPYSSNLAVRCLKEDLPEVLELLDEVLDNTSFSPDELKRMGQNRKIAWQSSNKDFMFKLEQGVLFSLFAEGDVRRSDYEEPAKVVKDDLTLLSTRSTLVRMPGRLIGFGGDLTRDDVEELAADLLPTVVSPDPSLTLEPVYLAPNTERTSSEVTLPGLTQTYFGYHREGITWQDPSFPAWLVADHVLGGHFFSRLYVALRHDDGDTYGAGTRGDPWHVPLAYGAWTFTRAENQASTEQKLVETVSTLAAEGITQQELDEAVSSLRGEQLLGSQSPGQVLDRALWEKVHDLPEGFRSYQIERAGELSLEEVNAFASDFYAPEHWTMLRLVAE